MYKRVCRRWTKEDNEFVRRNYEKLSIREIADSLQRTSKATRTQIERLGIRLCTLERNNRNWTTKEIRTIKENINLTNSKLTKLLPNRTAISICHKRREVGIEKPRPYWNDTKEGYRERRDGSGGRIREHREVMERMLGRKLKKSERVHHIDNKKNHNPKQNLYLCRDNSHHKFVHSNLERVAFGMVEEGIIKFDKNKGVYVR